MYRFLLSFITSTILLSSIVAASDQPYRLQQHRDIKVLSQKEQIDLLAGKGMGLAKAAELNHYPGPRHLLDHAQILTLTDMQVSELKKLFTVMQKRAIKLGKRLVKQEEILDQLFASSTINSELLSQSLYKITKIQSDLRFVHLNTHIKTKSFLSEEQIAIYDHIRGYDKPREQRNHN